MKRDYKYQETLSVSVRKFHLRPQKLSVFFFFLFVELLLASHFNDCVDEYRFSGIPYVFLSSNEQGLK